MRVVLTAVYRDASHRRILASALSCMRADGATLNTDTFAGEADNVKPVCERFGKYLYT